MQVQSQIKQGNVYTYQVPQNSANYVVRMALTGKGVWMCIQETYLQWKLTISEDLLTQTVSKASGNKQLITFREFIGAVVAALKKEGERWSIGIMTPIELEMLRGGNASKQSNNNKLYLILSDKNKKLHLPFTFTLQDFVEKDKLTQAIKTMKDQLDQIRLNNDKSQTSFSIMSESAMVGDQLKIENEELKRKIKMYEQSLTQKRGAVEIDNILREKNNLELLAENKKRQEAREITRLKNIHSLMERQINELRNEVDLINRQLMLLEDSMANPAKLKSHALRVLKSYQNDLRTSKKILIKQTKDIETLKRNLQTSKNNQKKNIAKIKQIQAEIEQTKKKANIKQISNRLHSPGNSKQGSSVGGSLKAPSVASDESDKKRNSANKVQTNNLVRQNLLNRTGPAKNDRNERSRSNTGANQLLKTTPNIKTPSIPRKTQYKPPVRPVVSSHIINNQGSNQVRQKSKQNDWNSAKSSSAQLKKRQFSPAQKQKQKQAMQRLTGSTRIQGSSNSKPAIGNSSSNKNINNATNTRTTTSVPKKDNAKDILNRMKEVKAQYNNRSKNSAVKEQGIAAKLAELTAKKQVQ